MSLAAVCAWSFVRAIAIALAAVWLSKWVAGWIWSGATPTALRGGGRQTSDGERQTDSHAHAKPWAWHPLPLAWAFVLAPFLVPPLLVGYAYSRLALLLIHYPFWNEIAYGVLLLLKFFPAAVVIRVFAPPSPVSAEAIHLERLLRRPGEPVLRRAARE